MIDSRVKFRHLQTFVEVARQKSVMKAAGLLNVSQPAVTKTIRELEEVLGVAVFERDGRGIKITRYGDVFLRHAGAALTALRQGLDSVSQERFGEAPPIRIGALPTVSTRIMPRAMELFLKENTWSRIKIVTGENAVLLEQLRVGDLDLVVGRLAGAEKMAGFSFEHLYSEQVVFAVRTGHPLLKARQSLFSNLGKYTILTTIAQRDTTNVGYPGYANAAVGDILNQGQFAIYVTNISEAGILLQGNNLWMPQAGTTGEHLKYDHLARAMGVELGGWSFGAQFGDLNNDGYLDLYLTNGYISADRNRSYWYDFSKVAGGNTTIIADAKNWPPMAGRSLSGYQQKRVWINDGAGQFFDVAQAVGITDTYDGRAVALADLWNRGVLDVVVVNQKGPLLLYKNTVAPDHQWIAFALEGSVSNRSAIGAQVRLFWNGQEQVQEVSGGSGFAAQNQRRVHFGLGKQPHIEKAVIRWPSGQVQTLTAPQMGQVYQVKEPG